MFNSASLIYLTIRTMNPAVVSTEKLDYEQIAQRAVVQLRESIYECRTSKSWPYTVNWYQIPNGKCPPQVCGSWRDLPSHLNALQKEALLEKFECALTTSCNSKQSDYDSSVCRARLIELLKEERDLSK